MSDAKTKVAPIPLVRGRGIEVDHDPLGAGRQPNG
jgi:hypothetical protein